MTCVISAGNGFSELDGRPRSTESQGKYEHIMEMNAVQVQELVPECIVVLNGSYRVLSHWKYLYLKKRFSGMRLPSFTFTFSPMCIEIL
jgi:hypothetical protein